MTVMPTIASAPRVMPSAASAARPGAFVGPMANSSRYTRRWEDEDGRESSLMSGNLYPKISNDFRWPGVVTDELLAMFHRRVALARAAVSVTTADCWREVPEFRRGDAEIDALERTLADTLDRIGFWRDMREAYRRALILGRAAVMLRVADNGAWSDPVESVAGGPVAVEEAIPVWGSDLTVTRWGRIDDGEAYGKPLMFKVAQRDFEGRSLNSLDVHPDRLLIISANGTLDCESALLPPLNALVDVEKVRGSMAEGGWRNARMGLSLEFAKDAQVQVIRNEDGVDNKEDEPEVGEQIALMMDDFFSRHNNALVNQGAEARVLNTNVGDLRSANDVATQHIAAAFEMPQTILVGEIQSERSSTENAKTWARSCENRRNYFIKPILREFLDRMLAWGVISGDWRTEWVSLITASSKERDDRARVMIAVNAQNKQAGLLPTFSKTRIREALGYKPMDAEEQLEIVQDLLQGQAMGLVPDASSPSPGGEEREGPRPKEDKPEEADMALDIADFDLTATQRDGAERVFVSMNLQVNTKEIRTFTRNGKEKMSIRAACLEDDSVMNRILYPALVIAESVYSFEGVPVPYGHPEDDQGRFLSANTPDGRVFGNLGGSFENVTRIQNSGDGNDAEKSRVWGDLVFDVETLMSTDHGREFMGRVKKKRPIGMSVGVYLDVVEKPSAADHDYEAVWMYGDHFAALRADEKPASTTKQGTGAFVNNRREVVELKMLSCNMHTPTSPALLPTEGAHPAPDPALAGNIDALDRGFLTKLLEVLSLHPNRGESACNRGGQDMADTDTKTGDIAAINTAVESAVNKAMESFGAKLPEIVANAVDEKVKPLIEANEAQAKANAESAAKVKAELVDQVVALNALPKEAAEAAETHTLQALVANSEASKGSATAANRSGDGSATNAYSEADLDAEIAAGSDSKEG